MIDPPSLQVAGVLASIFFLIAGWNQVEKFMDRRKDKPSPGAVRDETHERFVKKEEFRDHITANSATHAELFSKLGGVERGGRSHSDAHFEKVRLQVDDVARKVAGLEVETKNQTAWLERMDKKLDEIKDH